MKNFKEELEKLAIENGVTFIQCNEYHIQLKAIHVVNVWETKQSYHVIGATKKAYFNKDNPMTLIKVALGEANQKVSIMKTKRKFFSKSKKDSLKNKNDSCWICGELFKEDDKKTIEHKVPLDKGGSNRVDNLTLSHYECNQRRKNKLGKE